MYSVTKNFHTGNSCVFRQFGASSHCRFLHGYCLAISITITSESLDSNGWVVDFGNFKHVKKYLEDTFDHKLLVAKNDPELDYIQGLHTRKIADVLVIDAISCERFAKMIAVQVALIFSINPENISVTVSEHIGNSATYKA